MITLKNVRSEFKALDQMVNGKPLIYLDSAATTLKPDVVVKRIEKFYAYESSNVHRGAHFLSDQATAFYESARNTVKNFIGASSIEEIIFTKGSTDGINIIADCYGQNFLNENDEIVLTELEHHANIVPWQNLALKKKLKIKFIPVLESGEIDLSNIDQIITQKTKIVSFSGCSNTMGTFLPIEKIVLKAKSVGAITVLDAAQLISQKKIDVQKLDVDFLVFSAHKLFGPYGFGVLFGKKDLLEKMPPYQFGGNMISEVKFEKTTYNVLPYRFEAGTPHIEGAVALESAIQFFNQFNFDDVFQHEQHLLKYATEKLSAIDGIQFFGQAKDKAPIVSFNVLGAHHSDVGQILDQQGIAVRAGFHCTQPLLQKFNLTGTVRASFSIYNLLEDVDKLVEGVIKAKRMLL
jgi:cysteine desulfurase / selenocysteine lyase